MPHGFNLKIRPSCQTLSNAIEMSKKTHLTSSMGFSSDAVCSS